MFIVPRSSSWLKTLIVIEEINFMLSRLHYHGDSDYEEAVFENKKVVFL